MPDLKLLALDSEDLHVVSAHLQDAVVRVADMTFDPRAKRFAAVLNRFDWERELSAPDGRGKAKPHRRRTGLRFERVLKARRLRIDPARKEDVLALLAVRFTEKDAPAGCITLDFSGGMAIELDVECIEAELRDLGAAWTTRHRPAHESGDDGAT